MESQGISYFETGENSMDSKLTIRTNHVPRDVLRWFDLSPKEQSEFDYLDSDDRRMEAEFVRYRGWVYDLHDMERGWGGTQMPEPFAGWDNYLSDSYFSGILIKWLNDGEQVVCATWLS